MISYFKRSLATFVFLFFSSGAQASSELSLTVEVKGFELGKGQLIFSLFNSKESFLKSPQINRFVPVIDREVIVVRLDALETGTYAVAIIYDENSDGELDTNFLGIPTELVGVSNNAKGFFGPPSFEDASFKLEANKTLLIQLDNAKD